MSKGLQYIDGINGILGGLSIGVTGTYVLCTVLGHLDGARVIPSQDKVQSGYVAPSKLEIACKDLDGNGEKETIMKVNGKSYLLRYDAQGKPVIQDYEIKPIGVIVKE